MAVVIVDDLGWQLLQDFRLESAHDERHDLEMKLFQDMLLSLRKHEFVFAESSQVDFEEFLVVFLEKLFSVKVAWHQEVKEPPKLFEPVLDWSSRQDESVG